MVHGQKILMGGMLGMEAAYQSGLDTICCNILQAALPHALFSPPSSGSPASTDGYDLLNNGRWSNTSMLAPSCIFTPHTTAEVAKGIQILSTNKCRFSVKSGGHMPFPGANNIDNGVAVDLLRLNETKLATDRSYVSLGAGLTWRDAYDSFAGDGILFPGGICGTTGIGGLSTGGGMSLFQPKIGWVIDNILTYEVVLASGEVISANETHYSDLYRALKGGSSNFGVVTRIDLAAFDFDTLWGGSILVPAIWPNIGNSLEALYHFAKDNNNNVDAGLQMGMMYHSSGVKLIDVALASTSNSKSPEVLQAFGNLHLQLRNTLGHRTMSDFVKEVDEVQPKGWRDGVATLTIVNDLPTLKALQSLTDEVYQTVKQVPSMDFILMYVPQPRVIQSFAATRGGNILGLEDRDHDQISIFLSPRWKDGEYDEIMYSAIETWTERATKLTEEMGTADPFLYIGFAGSFQKPLCSYGEKNVEFMKRVSEKYDPNQVFQTLVPGGFKLSQAC